MQLIKNDIERLTLPCREVSLKEGREIARGLLAWLERNNKRAGKPLSIHEAKGGLKPNRPAPGVGLAAPQVGIDKRVCVTVVGGKTAVFINPRVIACSDAVVSWSEGCLSFPGETVQTFRRLWVVVKSDNWPEPRRFGPEGPVVSYEEILEAVAVQHEISHLFGLLMFDFQKRESLSPLEWFARSSCP